MVRKLFKFIRRQPKGMRDQIALGIAGTFTALVFTVWVYNAPAKFALINEPQDDNSVSAFSQLFSKVGEQFASVKEAIPSELTKEPIAPAAEDSVVSESIETPVSSVATTTNEASVALETASTTAPETRPNASSSSATTTKGERRVVRIVTSSSSNPTATSSVGIE